MGEHSAFVMKCELKSDTPPETLEILQLMVNSEDDDLEFSNPPNHPFFEVDCWEYTLTMGGGTLWDPNSTLEHNETAGTYTLNVRSSVKSDRDDIIIPKFLHWLAPYVQTQGIAGYRHMEYDNYEARVLFESGRAYFIEPVENYSSFLSKWEPSSEEEDSS